MGWKEAQQRYKDGSTINTQKTEDLVSRRVLRGLGLTEKQVPGAERTLFGESAYDMALWPRTYAVLRAMVAQDGSSRVFGMDAKDPGMFAIELLEVSGDHREILELVPQLADCTKYPYPVFLTRVQGTTISRAYTIIDPAQIGKLEWAAPPIQFIATASCWWVACQDTEQFIQRFGPYRNLLEQND